MELKQLKFQFFIKMKTQLKTLFLSCVFISQLNLCLSQGVNNIWILGYKFSNGTNGNTVINFDSLPVSPHNVDKQLSFRESNASICDKRGNLLFYTNGLKINNKVSMTMMNGDTLNPGWYASSWQNKGLRIGQGQLIIPFPNDSNKYYLFHETIDSYNTTVQPFHLFYSIIDMTLDSGRGAVTQKNVSFINDTLVIGEITACKHGNGRDWWIVVHRSYSDTFLIFLVSPNGISTPQTQNIGGIFTQGGGGQTCFSPDGKKYARYHYWDGIDIFDFNRCNGTFSNWQHTDSVTGLGGLAFSPNSKKLYVTGETNVYQFNLSDTSQTLTDLKFLVARWDSTYSPSPPFATTFYLAQLAPDKKIYINCGNGVPNLHVINYPDSVGLSCNLVQHAISLPTINAFTIPNHPNYFLGADSGSVCDTLILSNFLIQNSNRDALDLSVYPNPSQNYFYINYQLQSNEAEQFILTNSFGMEVLRKHISGESQSDIVNTTWLQSGIYFWKFQNQIGKIVIIK